MTARKTNGRGGARAGGESTPRPTDRPGPDPRIPNTLSVNVHWATVFLRPTFIRQTHRRGHHVVAWTVNDVPLMKLLLRLGVDGIVTNLPNLWVKI